MEASIKPETDMHSRHYFQAHGRRTATVLVLLLSATATYGQQAEKDTGDAAQPILDESAYWRYYVEFGMDRLNGEVLKSEGEKILGKNLKYLEKMVKRWNSRHLSKEERKDFTKTDWRDDARFFVTQVANVGCNDERISFHIESPPPPSNWSSYAFDDAEWSCQRIPLNVGNFLKQGKMHGDLEMQQMVLRGTYLRTSFAVHDPAAAKELELSLTFRGGARVFLNGKEIGRAFLPEGELKPATRAVPYGMDAYVFKPGEGNEARAQKLSKRVGGNYVDFCPDLPGAFEDGFVDARKRRSKNGAKKYWKGQVTREGWDRITAVRNRKLNAIKIPASALKKGRNVLAVEIRASALHPIVAGGKAACWGRSYIMGANYTWSHCRLLDLSLETKGGGVPSALKRPAGVQVWVEDVHRRLYSPEFGEPGRPTGTLRVTGVLNGTHGGQVVVGTDKELSGLKVTASALKSEGGDQIPAAAVQVAYMFPEPVNRMVKLGQWRGLPELLKDPLCPPAQMALLRHGPRAARTKRLARAERLAAIGEMRYFDRLCATPPEKIPADSCQPIWLSFRIPGDAKAGTYRGEVSVEAQGMTATKVPVEVSIHGWRVPDARHFQTFAAGEQSPYGVAKHYKCSLWSDEHFRLMENSFRLSARIGNRWLFVPVIQHTEFGNLTNCMIKWIRRKDGSLDFDYTILNRYLDLAVKHWGPPPVISFVVCHGTGAGAKATVPVFIEATEKEEALDLSSASPTFRKDWQDFTTKLYAFMRSKGLDRSLHWGYGWDGIGDPSLLPLFEELVPETGKRWTRGSHAGNRAAGGRAHYPAYSEVYGIPISEKSKMGWKRKDMYLLNPRAGSSVTSANGHSPPFAYRLLMDRALVVGLRGVGRIGIDYWDEIFYSGYKGRAWAGALPGIGCLTFLYSGKDGAESSQRFEVFLEGIQEAEARVFLEQALDRGLLKDEQASRIRDILFRHHRETLYFPVGRIGIQITEYPSAWRARSQRLFKAAAEVSGIVGLDVNRVAFNENVPARGKTKASITLRNWTSTPREWKASADKDWIVLAKTEGQCAGNEVLELTLDATRMKPGQVASGTVTVTDVASGRAYPVKVDAKVSKLFDFVVGKAYDQLGQVGHAASWHFKRVKDFATFNAPVGGEETREFVLLNPSGVELEMKIASPAAWLSVNPATLKIPAGSRALVNVTAKPTDSQAATHDLKLVVQDASGELKQEAHMVVHIIPPYKESTLPEGEAVLLSSLDKLKYVKAHKSRSYSLGTSDRRRKDYGPRYTKEHHILGSVAQNTVFLVKDLGAKAFSTRVKLSAQRGREQGVKTTRVSFEVYVDGKLRTQSGLMKAGEKERLLVVTGLEGASELRLHTRYDYPEPRRGGVRLSATWLEPKLHK